MYLIIYLIKYDTETAQPLWSNHSFAQLFSWQALRFL